MRFSTPAGAYEIDSVPSQPQVAHCHGFFVRHELRGRQVFEHANQRCRVSRREERRAAIAAGAGTEACAETAGAEV